MTFTSTKAERLALAKSDGATTYHQQATAQLALEDSGRFGALARERAAQPAVAGTEPFVRYPGGASWTSDPNMLEPPLGFSVDAMDPMGEAHEIAKATPVSPDDAALGEGAPADQSPQSLSPSPSTAARLGEPKIIRRRSLR